MTCKWITEHNTEAGKKLPRRRWNLKRKNTSIKKVRIPFKISQHTESITNKDKTSEQEGK